jgi:hypothetical protein
MKIRVFLIPAIVLSALAAGLSSNTQETRVDAKCAVASPRSSLQSAKAVFVGEVTSEEKNGDVKTFKFKVEKYWKGSGAKEIEIFVYQTMRYQSPFKEGEKFLVYAREDNEGRLSVTRCSRSRDIRYAEDDLRELGEGKTPK